MPILFRREGQYIILISQYNQLAVKFRKFFGKLCPGIQCNYQIKISKYQSKELTDIKRQKHSIIFKGVSKPPPLFAKFPLKSANCPSSSLGNPLYILYCFFVIPLP